MLQSKSQMSCCGLRSSMLTCCVVSSQLLTSMSQCLSLDPLSFSVWRQLYTKHLSQSRLVPAAVRRARPNLQVFRSVLNNFLEPLIELCAFFPPFKFASESSAGVLGEQQQEGKEGAVGRRSFLGWGDNEQMLL